MDPDFKNQNPPAKGRAGSCVARRIVLFLLIAAVYAAHQDVWNWGKADPMVFGFLPAGLAYHAAYSIGCAVLMWILVKAAWPSELDETDDSSK
ncbi:MAG TPA: hypothetical protein VGO59_16460 [Verrucomicrobiae bacterium]|jgi:hypothetical protein